MRLAADLSRMFLEWPEPARFAAAQAAGFAGVSLASPYDGPVQALRDRLVLAGLSFAAMQAPPPNYTGALPGYAATPGGEDRFSRDFKRMLRYAEVLKPAAIEILPGDAGDMETLLRCLRWACAEAPGRVFTLAPRRAGSVLSSYDQVTRVIAQVGAENLGLTLETGAAEDLGGGVAAVWDRAGPLIRHVSVTEEPQAGGPDLPGLLARLAAAGYAGWISADYTPRLGTVAGLGWMPPAAPLTARMRKR